MNTPAPNGRISQLQESLTSHDLDALVVSSATNIRYLTGFSGSNGTVVITTTSATLITDNRYGERAADELEVGNPHAGVDVEIALAPGAGHEELERRLSDCRTIGLEASDLSWSAATALSDRLGAERIQSTVGIVEKLRERKSPAEINLMGRAAAIADDALAHVIDSGIEGLTERDIQRRLDHTATDLGADGASFDTIVASGPNGSRPHHEAGQRAVTAGDLVIIDFGAEVGGYRSDMTRTFVLGTPTPQQRLMLEAVEAAQAAGVGVVAAGVQTSEIDAACRSVLADFKLEKYFIHGTGHGVGLDIHEAPSVSSTSTATLAPGHVITVEPGVYIPNVGGVRWEDTVVVTTVGVETLTKHPKQPKIDAPSAS